MKSSKSFEHQVEMKHQLVETEKIKVLKLLNAKEKKQGNIIKENTLKLQEEIDKFVNSRKKDFEMPRRILEKFTEKKYFLKNCSAL
ncbi:hypothetical protein VNO80_27413 [Phaseolus coccineus]|uniref:Uncharacterized protein n=1 Tax=Phaseolus coccineus TaxID=3886 RepID=A0AAN9LGB4_PHACN